MPQTIAQVTISFGTLSIPVSLHSAVVPHTVPLHLVHAACGSRVRVRRYCEAEGTEIPQDQIAYGYLTDDCTVILTDAELAHLPLPTARTVDVLAFAPADRVDPLSLGGPYYLAAESKTTARPYVLLPEAMARSGQIAIARTAVRGRETLAVLRPHHAIIAMQLMLWPDELRPTEELEPQAPLPRRQEIQMALRLMDVLSAGFHIEEQHDDYQQALLEVVTAKITGSPPPHAPEARVMPSQPLDLMEELQRSVEAAAAGGTGGPGQAEEKNHSKKRPTGRKTRQPPC